MAVTRASTGRGALASDDDTACDRARSERKAAGSGVPTAQKSEDNRARAAFFMALLALQIGVQPVLVSECIDKEKVCGQSSCSPTHPQSHT